MKVILIAVRVHLLLLVGRGGEPAEEYYGVARYNSPVGSDTHGGNLSLEQRKESGLAF